MASSSVTALPWTILLRVAAAVVGAYAAAAGLVVAGAIPLPVAAGMARSEAYALSAMLGFAAYLVAALWAISSRRLLVVYVVFLGLAAGGFALPVLLGAVAKGG